VKRPPGRLSWPRRERCESGGSTHLENRSDFREGDAFLARRAKIEQSAPARELASFFCEFPHEEFQPRARASGADVELDEAAGSLLAEESVYLALASELV